jgi:hypothetical protein
MDVRHPQMWQVVDRAEEIPDALERAPAWTAEYRNFAAV